MKDIRIALISVLSEPNASIDDQTRTVIVDILKSEEWNLPLIADTTAPACQNFGAVSRLCADGIGHKSLAAPACKLLRHLQWIVDYPNHQTLRTAFAHAILKASSSVLVGLNILAADTVYPAHAHRATEIYLPLSGGEPALWQQASDVDTRRKPGDIIFHASEERHGLQTAGDPLLNLWIQVGDDLGGPTWFT